MAESVLIAGGTGMLGSELTQMLIAQGYSVRILSRSAKKDKEGIQYFRWDPDSQHLDLSSLEGVDHVVNLSGRNINDKRWTSAFKEEIRKSRVEATRVLAEGVIAQKKKPGTFINASALGYYGKSRENVLTENDEPGSDFIAKVGVAWEAEALKASEAGIRTVIFRFGIILSADAGALKEITKVVNIWAGAPIGTGNQCFSWIHKQDAARMIVHAIQNPDLEGVYNAVADEVVTNREITQKVARVLNKPMFLPNVPLFMLKMIYGEAADYVTGNMNLSNQKIKSTGFRFTYPVIDEALENLTNHSS